MDNKDSKFLRNKKYNLISLYVITCFLVCIFLLRLIWDWAGTKKTIVEIFTMISPFFIGFLIAYLINPLVKTLNEKLFHKLLKIKKDSIRKLLSILVAYIIVITVLVICISIIIPELYTSITTIYESLQDYYDSFMKFLIKFSDKHPNIDIAYLTKLVQTNSSNIIDFMKGSIGTILPLLYNTSISVISWTFKILIALIVSCYMLIDKDRLLRNAKRFIYAIFKKERATKFCQILKESNKIFSDFVIGKTIDSVIIGFMCFIFMKIIGLKYAMLISVIVGITNMIPYFGPFIGAIPGIILLLTIDFQSAIIFLALILVLQQFDGLYLGPKILGEKTGLRPIWIIFAITVGGWLMGPLGMFLGVPIFAVIVYLIDRAITNKLKRKNIEI